MIEYIIAAPRDIESVMNIRFEMLKVVNHLPTDYEFNQEIVKHSRDYFLNHNQTTILAKDKEIIGCATICYTDIMPTFSHPTGKRAHLMNVYTNANYRRQGIGLHMVNMLIREAKVKGVTEISLDATKEGVGLYEKCGFVKSEECMVVGV